MKSKTTESIYIKVLYKGYRYSNFSLNLHQPFTLKYLPDSEFQIFALRTLWIFAFFLKCTFFFFFSIVTDGDPVSRSTEDVFSFSTVVTTHATSHHRLMYLRHVKSHFNYDWKAPNSQGRNQQPCYNLPLGTGKSGGRWVNYPVKM